MVLEVSVRKGVYDYWMSSMSKSRLVGSLRSKFSRSTPNMNPPLGLIVRLRDEGEESKEVLEEENMICRFNVRRPMLAKRMMKMMMIPKEHKPPVKVVYSASPLYLK
jgi:hypothetical protein